MKSERRAQLRMPVNIEATVVLDGGLTRLAARVVDQSGAGLRIRLEQERQIAGESYILFDRRIEPFAVVWQASRSVGLLFTGQEAIAGTSRQAGC